MRATESKTCTVEVVDASAALALHQKAWTELAAYSIEPNPFYEPFCLLPALELLAGKSDVRILLVWSGDGASRRLVGLLPVESAPVSPWLSVHAWMPWKHCYCFLTTPLIHREHASAAAQALLGWLNEAGKMTVLSCVGGGDFARLLNHEANDLRMGLAEAEHRDRAFFQAADSAEAYLTQAIAGRHRKGYRRMERQMAAMGVLEYKGLGTEPGALEKWIQDFLALEAAGWKGRAGTAFAMAAEGRAYFTQLIRNAHAGGRLMALGLYLDGRPVAMKANLLARDGGFCFKICFDEAFSKYSPGVLLELENIREAHRMGLVWMDSCADQDHPMIDRLWPERRQVQMLFLAPKLLGIASIAGPLAALRQTKRALDRPFTRYQRAAARPMSAGETRNEVPAGAEC
jgi:CelD/BcsL family acetyltransferase involved in cellulose biosynthesis